MECLTIEQIYLLIENELSQDETARIQSHLALCPQCRKAVEERRIFVQAAESLPVMDVPPNFAEQVMAKIFPSRIPLRVWIKASAAGLSAVVAAFFLFYVFSGNNLADLLIGLNRSLIPALRSLSTGLIKAFKLVWQLIGLIFQFFDFAIKGIGKLGTLLSPEVQIGLITVSLVAIALSGLALRKKFLFGEKA